MTLGIVLLDVFEVRRILERRVVLFTKRVSKILFALPTSVFFLKKRESKKKEKEREEERREKKKLTQYKCLIHLWICGYPLLTSRILHLKCWT